MTHTATEPVEPTTATDETASPRAGPIETLVHRVVASEEGAVDQALALQRADASAGRALFCGMAAAAQELYRRHEQMGQRLESKIVPAMVRGYWTQGETRYFDVSVGGREIYCLAEEDDASIAEVGVGDEIAIAMVEDGPALFVRALGRPFASTGAYGRVLFSRRREDGRLELTLEAEGREHCLLASREVERAFERGEVDALGGLPISAVHKHEIVWRVEQPRGRSERASDDLRSVRLEDFAGYRDVTLRVTRALARHVLRLEPDVLTSRAGLRRRSLRSAQSGVILSGLPGTGKTYLTLAVIGSCDERIGHPKARAKRAAIRLFAAQRPDDPLFDLVGSPTVEASLVELREAIEAQYRGIRSFGFDVRTPEIPGPDDPALASFTSELLAGYQIPEVKAAAKLRELDKRVEGGESDFMRLRILKEDYLRPYVGEGVGAMAAQLKRAKKHDDLCVLWMPEAEVLLGRRGHRSRYYTDELVGKLLEELEGPTACENLFLFADSNRRDMLDSAFSGRRLMAARFPGLLPEDREAVVRTVLAANGVDAEEIDELAEGLLDRIYATTEPLCELVLADESRRPLTVDHVLTPAVIQNVASNAAETALEAGRTTIEAGDLASGWEREVTEQAERFSEEEIIEIIGLDRKTASRVIDVRRGRT